MQKLFETRNDLAAHALHALRQELRDHRVGVDIDDQPRQQIAFGMHQAVASEFSTTRARCSAGRPQPP